MMGMKKFSSGRKQVLNLDGSPNENRSSWKSKYEQICAVHVNNGDPVSPKEEEDERIEPKKSTALIGLSGYHSTESSSDDSDLEDEVRSFLREVDNIYIVERAKPIVKPPTNPTVEKIQKLAKEMQAKQNMSERKGDSAGPKAPTNTTAWQECYDNSTGFTYYWNMETNDVTWDMPLEYQAYVEALKHWQQQQANGVVARMQQARAQHLQQQHQQQQHQQQQIQQKQEMQTLMALPKPPKEERVFKYCKKKKKDDNEKIELITSYGPNSGDEDWSDQEGKGKKKKDVKSEKVEKKNVETSHKNYHHRRKSDETPRPIGSLVPYHHDDSESDEPQISKEDEVKIKLASKIRDIVHQSDSNSNLDDDACDRLKSQDIDSDSESNKLKSSLKSKLSARAKHLATTLGTFETPDLSEDSKDKDDFVASNPFASESSNLIESSSGVGIKRKLKIEIPQPPKKEESPFRDSVKETEKAKDEGSKRQKIEKIQFVKAETLQPQKEESTEETDTIDIKDVSSLLLDKMKFLSSSKEPVSAVQLWAIQLETLVSAWESNDLKRSYITEWLTNTMKELERLESTVAPEGWLCQWQRKEKCYSYTNERSGRVVWEFPQASDLDEKESETEKIGGEEDMEVCTTPPPLSPPRDPSPPPPPNISPPTPPPPPSISHPDENPILPPLPPLPPPSEPPTPPPPPPDEPPPQHLLMEPLPPGVDAPELLRPIQIAEYPVAIPGQLGMHLIPQLHYTLYPQPTLAGALGLQPRLTKSGDLSSELDSFYSDLASLEPEQPLQPSLPSKESTPPLPQTSTLDATDASAKKKKKTKLAPGLALKKKGVSSLVAKWQQVQEDVRRDLKNIDN